MTAASTARAQRIDGVLPLSDPVHRFLERQQTAGRLPGAFLSHQPLSAYEAQDYLDTLAARRAALSNTDRRLLARYRYEEPGPNASRVNERIGWLYANGHDLLSARPGDFALQATPLLYLSHGQVRRSAPDGGSDGRDPWATTWQNTRGVRAAGHLDLGRGVRLFFDTQIEETQRRDLNPSPRPRNTAPRQGRTRFDDGVYDYTVATGGVGVRSEHFEVRFGRWRNEWGAAGGTSVLLSDYAPPYDQLQIRTSVWRLQYTNLFTAFDDLTFPDNLNANELPRRYGAFHRLAVRLPGRVQLGLFESVIFSDRESGNQQDGFDPAYLNPVIFYRAVQADRGSPGNLIVGADASWRPAPGLKAYGEFLLDEFVVDEIFTDSWRNKWGGLIGLHMAGVLAPRLSVRLEYARMRPLLYGHREPATAYLHYDDLLGHPAGPNAYDLSLLANYQPSANTHLALSAALTRRGRGTDTLNVGADPRRSYQTRFANDVPFLSGIRQSEILLEARAGYELFPQFVLEAVLRYESTDDAERGWDRYLAPQLSLRWGLPFRSARY
jgi:hypothetical protein